MRNFTPRGELPILLTMRRPSSALLYLVCLFVGQWLSAQSWGGLVYLYMGEERAPAAVRTLTDYVPVAGEVVRLSPSAQLLHSAEITTVGGVANIHLGNPILRLPTGRLAFACPAMGRTGVYDKVELTFMAEGIAVSGEVPRMTFSTNCQAEANATRISNLKLNIPTQAESWALTGVRFFNEGEAPHELGFERAELRAHRASLLKFGPENSR